MKYARFNGAAPAPIVVCSADGLTWRSDRGVVEAVDWAPVTEGTVIGVLLNDRESLNDLADAFTKPPYLNPPLQPVLYIKPRNTLSGHGKLVKIPRGESEVEVGAALGVVFSATTRHASERDAFNGIKGYTIAMDLGLPQASLLRPPVREKCFDGACPIGPWIISTDDIASVETLDITTRVNGTIVARRWLRDLVRPLAQLISAVSEFMTIRAGDVLLAGVANTLPRARAGDVVDVDIADIGRLSTRLVSAAP
jgi:5-oxopent-3-ene-1,2,5-tricarboxylate decarboxylase / 2-hydroxyhepta-2,4-diene-1,7-dioate isomerase